MNALYMSKAGVQAFYNECRRTGSTVILCPECGGMTAFPPVPVDGPMSLMLYHEPRCALSDVLALAEGRTPAGMSTVA